MHLPFPFSLLIVGRRDSGADTPEPCLDIFNCNDILSPSEVGEMYNRQR